jgi:hypothetical protein
LTNRKETLIVKMKTFLLIAVMIVAVCSVDVDETAKKATTNAATTAAASTSSIPKTSTTNKKLPPLPENVLAQLIDLYGLDFSIIVHVPSVNDQTFVTIKQIPPL